MPYTFVSSGRLTKFQRPAFGNQNVYTSRQNQVLGFGPPGNAPPPPPPPSTSSTKTSSTTSSSTSSSSTSSTTTSKTSTTSSTSTSRTSTTSSSSSTQPSTTRMSSTSSSTTLITTTKASSTSGSTSSSSTSSSVSTIPYPSYTSYPLPKGIRRTYNWNITWVSASPDGFRRPFVGINGQWPCPPLTGNLGDTITINVYNGLGNQSTAIHFHGLFQRNTTYSDGASMVTQCPIMPGDTFVYQFTVSQTCLLLIGLRLS